MTAVLGMIRPGDDPCLVIAAAGHPPALLLRDGRGRPIDGGGRLLGVGPGLGVAEQRIALRPGDVVVLHTDGLTDAGAPGRMLSTVDLLRAVEQHAGRPAEDVAAALERLALEGAGGAPRDDLALVVLRYTG
jgi:phosphoserine phosphatase RsbU/P